jgi:hypothetical protein
MTSSPSPAARSQYLLDLLAQGPRPAVEAGVDTCWRGYWLWGSRRRGRSPRSGSGPPSPSARQPCQTELSATRAELTVWALIPVGFSAPVMQDEEAVRVIDGPGPEEGSGHVAAMASRTSLLQLITVGRRSCPRNHATPDSSQVSTPPPELAGQLSIRCSAWTRLHAVLPFCMPEPAH